MYQKVNARDLTIGMFIADLDRPWIDTPFLMQGFLVEDDDQLRQLRDHCQWAMIDPQRSVGDEYDRRVTKTPATPREQDTTPRVVTHRAQLPVHDTASNVTTPAPSAAPQRKTLAPAKGGNPNRADRDGTTAMVNTSIAPPPKVSAPATAQDSDHRDVGNGRRGFWGHLKEGVSGLFARKQEEEAYTDEVPENEEPATQARRPSFIPETVHLTIYQDKHTVEEEIGSATAAFERTNELLHRVVEDLRAGGSLQLESVEEVIDDMVDSMVRNPDAMMWVAKIREQDLTIYGHGLSVAVSLVAFGRHLGYPKEQLAQLGMLGLLLDVGKIKIPRELLEKNARLSSDEFEKIKEHVEIGINILSETPNIHPDVLEGIAQHHERMNGTGYPGNLMGDKIGVFGRMSAIADTYNAVTRHRPYAEAISSHEALQMLSTWSGTQFHADMVEQFIQSIGVFPVGSLVELSTGEVGVVVTHHKQRRLRPKVLVIAETDKSVAKHPVLRDLLYDVSDSPAYIRRGLPSNAYGLDPSEYYLT